MIVDSNKSITANFLAVPLPYLSGLSRDSVAGGDLVTLSGMGFSTRSNKSYIYIGTKKVSVLSWSDTSITIKTPFRMPAAIYYIFVVTNNGQETNRLPLQVMAPEIDGVLPDYSLVHGSSSLSGKFLGPEAKVTLISVLSSRRHRARVVVSDDSHILFIVPRVRKGAYKVIVSTPQGKSNSVDFNVE
ncbi:MAG: IPT/TIG domain-containing protein [Nitrospirota bacterium]